MGADTLAVPPVGEAAASMRLGGIASDPVGLSTAIRPAAAATAVPRVPPLRQCWNTATGTGEASGTLRLSPLNNIATHH
jgi:hypothetical protein